MVKTVKCENIIVKKNYVTEKDITKNHYSIIFKAKNFDNKTMEFYGEYTINYKNINYKTEGIYDIGDDIRYNLIEILRKDFHLNFVLYPDKSDTKDAKILLEILKLILPKCQNFQGI